MKNLTTPAGWKEFLKDFAGGSNGNPWPGGVSATEEKLLAAEQRLKIKLPPSYRAFLSASNGWTNASRAVPILKPVEKLKWFKREHRDWVEAYTAPMQGMDLPLSTLNLILPAHCFSNSARTTHCKVAGG
jgi:hypothetical protein